MRRAADGRLLNAAVLATILAGIILPILAGAGLTIVVAAGYLPEIGAHGLSLDPFRTLSAVPGVGRSLALTVFTGAAAVALSLALAAGIFARLHGRMSAGLWARILAPLLATPHAAMALGVAFLIAPSGWIARLISPWATGWTAPPDVATVGDPFGLALVLGLVLKETPFFLLVMMSAAARLPVAAELAAGRSLGRTLGAVWLHVVWPQLYPRVRLAVFVALSFSLSVVDMALILGPDTPPTLAVLMTRWFLAPDLRMIPLAAAAAVSLTVLSLAAIGLALLAERFAGTLVRRMMRRGPGPLRPPVAGRTATVAGAVLLGIAAGSLIALVLWSFTFRWSFAEPLPGSWSVVGWTGADFARALARTIWIATVSSVLSLCLAILWLEAEDRRGRPLPGAETAVYLPLLLPQLAFVPCLYVVALRAGVAGSPAAVVWGHTLFTFPHVMIALARPWRSLDPRFVRQAAALGAGPWRRLARVKLPLLLAPLGTAAAIGVAVSVALYLPTLFLGAGRVATLTTEAVTLSSGSDRRVAAALGLTQVVVPCLAYAAAVMLPALIHRNRRGMSGVFA
jgi:putative thiamine transport system permease protein